MSPQSVSCLDAPPCDDHRPPPQIGVMVARSICYNYDNVMFPVYVYTLGGRSHFSMAVRREQRDRNDYLGEHAI